MLDHEEYALFVSGLRDGDYGLEGASLPLESGNGSSSGRSSASGNGGFGGSGGIVGGGTSHLTQMMDDINNYKATHLILRNCTNLSVVVYTVDAPSESYAKGELGIVHSDRISWKCVQSPQ